MTSAHEDRLTSLFDQWARDYDASVLKSACSNGFPFTGYSAVLNAMVLNANPEAGHRVLDLGIGTGNLAARFAELGCRIVGTDISPDMLSRCRAKLPDAELIHWDFRNAVLPASCRGAFDCIVSSYALHHLDAASRANLISMLVRQALRPKCSLVIGDISFATLNDAEEARERWSRWWDPDEFYWVAEVDVPQLEREGLRCEYATLSECAGVYRITAV